MRKSGHLLVALLLALAVPFQGALAVSAAQQMGMGEPPCDSQHGKDSTPHCGAHTVCCTAAAIADAVRVVGKAASHGPLEADSHLPLLGDPPSRLDRPPRFAS